MPKFHIEVTAMVTQTVLIDADSIETAEQVATDQLKRQMADYQSDAQSGIVRGFGSNIQHEPFSVGDYDIYDSYEAE